MKKVFLDIETGDPDDLYMLALMATHPRVDLRGVTVFPGGRDQIGLVKKVLSLVGRSDIIVGANMKDDGKQRVSKYYSNWLGKIESTDPDCGVWEAFCGNWNGNDYDDDDVDKGLEEYIRRVEELKDCSLLTGAALTNILYMHEEWELLKPWEHLEDPLFKEWICQGGFVGSNMLPKEKQLEKFYGKTTCPTFNLNGDPKASLSLLGSNSFGEIRMVGKNVCHGFVFNDKDANSIAKGKHAGLDLMIEGLKVYCAKKPDGKAMHDILAALMLLNPEYGEWIEGEPFRSKGEWGFRYGSSVKALTGVDREAAVKMLEE